MCKTVTVLAMVGWVTAAYGGWTWTTVDYPAAGGETSLYGIAGDLMVGLATTSSSATAFLYDGRSFDVLEYPGAANTHAYGMSSDTIVGRYVDQNGARHAYTYDGTTWTSLDFPDPRYGVSITAAVAVSGNTVVGYYYSHHGPHGFIYDGTTWTTLDFPNARETWLTGVSGNRVVGRCDEYSFVYDGTTFTPLGYAGARTEAWGISGENIVGGYHDGTTYHGFLYDGTTWTTLDYPGAISTRASGISGNRIVGSYTDNAGNDHGFILAIPEPASGLLVLCAVLGLVRRR